MLFGHLLVLSRLFALAFGQGLDAETRPNLVLWLSAETGVEESATSKTVLRWRDQSGGNYVFAPLSPAQHRAAAARWKIAVTRQEGRVLSEDVGTAMQFVSARRQKKTSVTFPAPLIANRLQLRDGITAFFVLTPTLLREGDQAIGQRFFGHYPFGQFRLHDRRLGFKTESGDHVHSTEISQGETILAVYRFDGDVQISLNGGPFESNYRGKRQPPTFSASGYVSIGGCPPHNSFVGDIAEVMVFGIPLNDRDARHVAEILAERHDISLSPNHLQHSPEDSILPQAHRQGAQLARRQPQPSPAIPDLSDLIDASPLDNSQNHKRLRASDVVSVYRRVKEQRRAHTPATRVPSQSELLAQLREAQSRLAQLQDVVQQRPEPPPPPPLPSPPREEVGQSQRLAIPAATNRLRRDRRDDASSARAVASSGTTGSSPPLSSSPAPYFPANDEKKKSNSCLGGDAFEKISITRWKPPETARFEEIQRWKEAKSESDASIKSFPRGGKELRDFVHKQVESMRLLRHKLFCGLV